MFNNRKDARPAAGTDAATTLIAAGTKVRGDVHFSGRLHLDGNVEGAIRGEGEHAMLTLSEHAVVTGEVQAPHIVVDGTINGKMVHRAEPPRQLSKPEESAPAPADKA